MPDLGSPLSFGLGGGPSPQQAVYDALRSAVGEGNSAPGEPHESIVEAWRYARARGLAAAQSDERAANQADPRAATDFIPVYEDILRLYFELATDEQSRRDALSARYSETLPVDHAALLAELQAINPDLTITDVDRAETRDTQPGRAFEEHDPTAVGATAPAMSITNGATSGPRCTGYPNFSTDFLLLALAPLIVSGTMGEEDKLRYAQLAEVLNRVLPAWIGFRLYAACGFELDTDLLDVTVFCQ